MNEEVHNGRVDLFMEQLRNWMWYSYHFSGGVAVRGVLMH